MGSGMEKLEMFAKLENAVWKLQALASAGGGGKWRVPRVHDGGVLLKCRSAMAGHIVITEFERVLCVDDGILLLRGEVILEHKDIVAARCFCAT